MSVTVSGLWVYPIKSCAGIALDDAVLTADGLQWDRHWMLVDADGRFLTQREQPRMALIRTALDAEGVRVSAQGRESIHVPFVADGARVCARVWRDDCAAFDCGDSVAQWFSAVMGAPCRLVAFDPAQPRPSDAQYTHGLPATSRFSDGFAALVIGDASLGALNERLLERGHEAVPITRFRPNLTLAGLEAFEEDFVDALRMGEATLKLVKPCARCTVTTVDPQTGVRDSEGEPLATLNGFRVHREFGTVFGQNAIVAAGVGARIAVGDAVDVEWNF